MDVQILISIITGFLALVISVISIIYRFNYDLKLTNIREELDKKKQTDLEIIKFILSYETQKANEIVVCLKEYLTSTQILKDKLKQIAKLKSAITKKELELRLNELREFIINSYSKAIYFLDSNDVDRNAHSIKNTFLEMTELLEEGVVNQNKFEACLNSINKKQDALRAAFNLEVAKIIENYKTT